MGIRGNVAVADTNRDYFLQSQPEEQIDAIQQQWLATGALHLHGYVTPTPSTATRRRSTWAPTPSPTTRGTQADAPPRPPSAAGLGTQSPVLDWNASGNIGHVHHRGARPSRTTVTITTTASNSSQFAVGYTVVIDGVTEAATTTGR